MTFSYKNLISFRKIFLKNLKNLFFLIKNKPLLTSILIYICFAFFIIIRLRGNTFQLTADFDFYHSFVHRHTDFFTSSLSKTLFEESNYDFSIYTNENYEKEWIPSPFYSLIFLSPIIFFGNKFLFVLLGLIIGITQLITINKLLANHDFFINKNSRKIILLIVPFNIYFVINSLSVSAMSVAVLFILLGLNSKIRIIKILCFISAALIRANYIFIFFSIVMALLIIKPRKYKQLIMDLIPSLVMYIIFYFEYYSSYPGSGFNYIFNTLNQGISYTIVPIEEALQSALIRLGKVDALKEAIKYTEQLDIMNEQLDIDNIQSLKISFFESLRLLFDFKILHLVLHAWFLKISIILGFVHESAFTSQNGMWLAKSLRSIYTFLFILPGFYISLFQVFLKKASPKIATVYLASIIYVLTNALIFADPRFLMGFYVVFVAATLDAFTIFNSFSNHDKLNI